MEKVTKMSKLWGWPMRCKWWDAISCRQRQAFLLAHADRAPDDPNESCANVTLLMSSKNEWCLLAAADGDDCHGDGARAREAGGKRGKGEGWAAGARGGRGSRQLTDSAPTVC